MTPHTSFTTPHRIGLVVCMTALMLCAPMTTHQASAVDIGSALIEACYGQDADNTDALKEATAAECKAKQGSEDACQATSGTPWACNDPVGPTDKSDRRCKKTSAQISLSGGISLPAGWSISGSISAALMMESKLTERERCSAVPKSETASGAGGRYVRESAVATLDISFQFNAGFTLTFQALGQDALTIEVEGSVGCDGFLSTDVHKVRSVKGCGPPDVIEPEPKDVNESDATLGTVTKTSTRTVVFGTSDDEAQQ